MLIRHPLSGKGIEGTLLSPGETLEAKDVYASSTGNWESCPGGVNGLKLKATNTTWVRPNQPVSATTPSEEKPLTDEQKQAIRQTHMNIYADPHHRGEFW